MNTLKSLRKTIIAAALGTAAAGAQAATVDLQNDVFGQDDSLLATTMAATPAAADTAKDMFGLLGLDSQTFALPEDSHVTRWTPFSFHQELASPALSTLAVFRTVERHNGQDVQSCELKGMKNGEAHFALTSDFDAAIAGGADPFTAMAQAPQVDNETLRYQAQYITSHMFADNDQPQPFVRIQAGAPINEQAYIKIGDTVYEATVQREDNEYTLYVNDNATRAAITEALTKGNQTVSVLATSKNGHAMQFDFKGNTDLSQSLSNCLTDLADGGFTDMKPDTQIGWTISEAPEMPEEDRRQIVESVAGSFCLRDDNPADLYDLRVIQQTTGFNVPTHLALYNKQTGETLVADYVVQKGNDFTLSLSMGQDLEHRVVSCAGQGVTIDASKPLTPAVVIETLFPAPYSPFVPNGHTPYYPHTPHTPDTPVVTPETPATVPLPGTASLMIAGALALFGASRLRRREPAPKA